MYFPTILEVTVATEHDAEMTDSAPLFSMEAWQLRQQLAPFNQIFAGKRRSARKRRVALEEALALVSSLASDEINDDEKQALDAVAEILKRALPGREILTEGATTAQFEELTYVYYDDKRGSLVQDTKKTRELARELMDTTWGGEFVTKSRPVIYKVDVAALKKFLMENPAKAGEISLARVELRNKFKIVERQTPEEISNGVQPYILEVDLT